jgi:hypothetical protein
MTDTKLRQVDKVEMEWESENRRLFVRSTIANGKLIDVSLVWRSIDGVESLPFCLHGLTALDDLFEGVRVIRGEVAEKLQLWGSGRMNDPTIVDQKQVS